VTGLSLEYIYCPYNYIPYPSAVIGFPVDGWDGYWYVFYPQYEPYATYSINGAVRSYNLKEPTKIWLMQDASVIQTLTIESVPGSGQIDQLFTFEDVEFGTYDLVIEKKAHTTFTVQSIIVDDEDVDLTVDDRPEVRLMTLRCGDIDGDGFINDSDLTVLWMLENYNRKTSDAEEPLCDLNGDGMINDMDLTILWMAYNYNSGSVTIPGKPPGPQLALVISCYYYFTTDGIRLIRNYEATIVDINGKVWDVPTTADMYNGLGGPFVGKVCSFSVNHSEYTFVALSDTSPTEAADGSYIVEPRIEEIRNSDTYLYPRGGLAVQRANSATKFIIVNFDEDGYPDGTIDMYIGINTVKNCGPFLSETTAVSYEINGIANQIANIVYIFDESASYKSKKLVYIRGGWYLDSDGFHVSVIIDGMLDEIIVADLELLEYSGELVNEVKLINGKLLVTDMPIRLGTNIFDNVIVENIGGLLMITGEPLMYDIADDTPVYIISVPGGDSTRATVISRTAENFTYAMTYRNAKYHLVIDGNEVVEIYIIRYT